MLLWLLCKFHLICVDTPVAMVALRCLLLDWPLVLLLPAAWRLLVGMRVRAPRLLRSRRRPSHPRVRVPNPRVLVSGGVLAVLLALSRRGALLGATVRPLAGGVPVRGHRGAAMLPLRFVGAWPARLRGRRAKLQGKRELIFLQLKPRVAVARGKTLRRNRRTQVLQPWHSVGVRALAVQEGVRGRPATADAVLAEAALAQLVVEPHRLHPVHGREQHTMSNAAWSEQPKQNMRAAWRWRSNGYPD